MNSEASQIVEAARAWTSCHPRVPRSPVLEKGWQSAGLQARELLDHIVPDVRILERVSLLFDQVASELDDSDEFGERYEVGATLAFLGWHHSCGLGLEAESQEWLRVGDVLAQCGFVAAESLKDFLFLPRGEKNVDLVHRFLARPEDMFLALALIRQARFTDLMGARDAAWDLHQALVSNVLRYSDDLDNSYFSGEAALIVGTCERNRGERFEVLKWLISARRIFSRLPAGRPNLARVDSILAMNERDRKCYQEAFERSSSLIESLRNWGMHRDWLLARLIQALCVKELGDSRRALSMLVELRDASEGAEATLRSTILSYLG